VATPTPGRARGARPNAAASDRIAELETLLGAREAELAALRAAVEVESRRIAAELDVARRVQTSLMPRVASPLGGWDVAVHYKAARIVGGDFYDVYELPAPDEAVGLAVADVTGKGVTAALLMAFARAVMRSAAYNASGPLDTLERTNRVFAGDIRTGLFLTAFAARLYPNGVVRHASAGHEPGLVWRSRSGRVDSTGSAGVMLGLFGRIGAEERTLRLAPGDVLLAYTDGATDAQNADGARFGERRLRAAFRDHAPRGAAAVVDGIRDAIEGFCSDAPEPADDVTLLAVGRSSEG
jgi:serine phosphatase RsbU (regulator of sigma subunit)